MINVPGAIGVEQVCFCRGTARGTINPSSQYFDTKLPWVRTTNPGQWPRRAQLLHHRPLAGVGTQHYTALFTPARPRMEEDRTKTGA